MEIENALYVAPKKMIQFFCPANICVYVNLVQNN